VMSGLGVWVWRGFFVRRGVEIPRCARNDMNRARNDKGRGGYDVDRVGGLCTTSLTTDSRSDQVRLPLPCPSGWTFRPLKRRLSPE